MFRYGKNGNPPPGWYQNSEGINQWWNGESWTEIFELAPDGGEVKNSRKFEKKPHQKPWLWLSFIGITVLVVLVLSAVLIPEFNQKLFLTKPNAIVRVEEEPIQAEEEPLDTADQPNLTNETDQRNNYDRIFESDGFNVIESGKTYFRFLTDEESATGSCGYWDCAWIVIASTTGCSKGFYVKADILLDSTPVSWTNVITPSAREFEQIIVTLEDHQDIGNSFRVSELRCMG